MPKILEVYNSLLSGPQSIADLQKSLDLHRTTITNYIEILKDLNVIHEYKEKNKRIMKISKNYINNDNETYYNLPIKEKDKKICHYLFSKINEDWLKEKKCKPSRIAVQKIVTETANKLDLSIPRSWYKYGEITVCVYDEHTEYECNINEVSELIDIKSLKQVYFDVMKKYLKADNFNEFMKLQYEESSNTLYMTKLEFEKLLLNPNDDNETNIKRVDMAYKLIFNFPNIEKNEKVKELLEAFVSSYVTLIMKHEMNEEMKKLSLDVFKDLWDFIATNQFISGLSKFYDEEIIDMFLGNHVITNYQKASDSVSNYVTLTYCPT